MSNAITAVHATPQAQPQPSAAPPPKPTAAETQNATPQDKVTISNSAKQELANQQTKPAGG